MLRTTCALWIARFRAHSRFFVPLLLIHAAYFIAALVFRVIATQDSPEYLFLARNILEGQLYSASLTDAFDAKFLTLRTPGYALFVLLSTAFSKSLFFLLFLQNMLSIAALSGLYFLWRSLLPGFKASSTIIMGILLFPTGMIYVNMIMAEVLFQALLFWAFYCLVRYVRLGYSRFMLAYNLLIIAALFVKPVLLYFWLPNLMLSAYLAYGRKDWKVAIMPLLLPLCAFFYCEYNEARSGYFHFSSIKKSTYSTSMRVSCCAPSTERPMPIRWSPPFSARPQPWGRSKQNMPTWSSAAPRL